MTIDMRLCGPTHDFFLWLGLLNIILAQIFIIEVELHDDWVLLIPERDTLERDEIVEHDRAFHSRGGYDIETILVVVLAIVKTNLEGTALIVGPSVIENDIMVLIRAVWVLKQSTFQSTE